MNQILNHLGQPLLAPEAKSFSIEELAARLRDSGYGQSASGVVVSREKAIQVGAMTACARVIADGCATPPLEIYRTDADGTRRRADDELSFKLLNRRPNPWMTSFTFRRTMTLHAAFGDAVALRTRRGDRTLELIPVPPQFCEIERRPNWDMRYHISDPFGGDIGTFGPKDVFHLRGLSWDGFEGLETVKLAREALGLSLRIEGGQADLHRNGVKLSGFLTTEQSISPERVEQIRTAIRDFSQKNSGGVGVLDMGFKYDPMSMTMVDAQTLEQRRFQIEEICRFMGVFPQMVGQSDKTSTYASAESFFSAHLLHTLAPWHENWVQEIDAQLLDGAGPLWARFNTERFEKASQKDRAEAARSFVEMGVKTRNDVRREEGLDPLPGLDEPLTPLNMQKGIEDE